LASEVQKLIKTKYGWNEGLIIELTLSRAYNQPALIEERPILRMMKI
jgi:hypothetical protein